MANINIKFNGKDFLLSCDDGQEEHLEELSIHLNNKFDNLKKSLGNIGENKLLLITSISVMDEYFETRKKIEEQKNQINIITEKFKELKNRKMVGYFFPVIDVLEKKKILDINKIHIILNFYRNKKKLLSDKDLLLIKFADSLFLTSRTGTVFIFTPIKFKT